jgi:hypothetical protein
VKTGIAFLPFTVGIIAGAGLSSPNGRSCGGHYHGLPGNPAAQPVRPFAAHRTALRTATSWSARVSPPGSSCVATITALLISEIQVIGISRSPRGYAAIIEATPIKLSYVIYPGEPFFDGQLVAIEDNRLVFRRETVFTDGRRERQVEYKPLRQPTQVNSMSNAPANPSVATAQP